MEVIIPISMVMVVLGLLIVFGVVIKLVFETVLKFVGNGSSEKPTVYMLKVAPDGTVKIRKYNGSVNYMSEKSWKDVI